MDNVANFEQARFNAASHSHEVTAQMVLREAARAIDDKELPAQSVIVVALSTSPEGATRIDLYHGGQANNNERLGMLTRAQALVVENMLQGGE